MNIASLPASRAWARRLAEPNRNAAKSNTRASRAEQSRRCYLATYLLRYIFKVWRILIYKLLNFFWCRRAICFYFKYLTAIKGYLK